jgi:hypothetical protein
VTAALLTTAILAGTFAVLVAVAQKAEVALIFILASVLFAGYMTWKMV